MIEKEREGEIQISKKVYKKEERKGLRRTKTKLENKTTNERGEEKCVWKKVVGVNIFEALTNWSSLLRNVDRVSVSAQTTICYALTYKSS